MRLKVHAAAVFLVASAPFAEGKDARVKAEPIVPLARAEFVNVARSGLQRCKEEYVTLQRLEALTRFAKAEIRRLEDKQPADAVERAAFEKDQAGPGIKDCVAAGKTTVSDAAKRAAGTPANRQYVALIRDVTAQAMTALDAIPERNGSEEASKFETLANKLLLDF